MDFNNVFNKIIRAHEEIMGLPRARPKLNYQLVKTWGIPKFNWIMKRNTYRTDCRNKFTQR